jgi:hypothetical protein
MSVPKVIVIWSKPDLLEEGIVNMLNSYNGVRIYEKDKLDSRLITKEEPTLPYFDDMIAAQKYMYENPDKLIQLDLTVARQYKLAS